MIELCSFILVFFQEHSRFPGQQGGEEGISLIPLYHFHTFHRHLNISWAISAESSLLHIASSRTQTRNLWIPSATCKPLRYAPRMTEKLNYNFVLLLDYMSDLASTVSRRQAVDLKLYPLSSHHYKRKV